MKLRSALELSATLRLLSGLHIGAGKETIEIGGMDNPVMRHPVTREPYIPGSSLKGKLRCLLEWHRGSVEADGSVWGSKKDGEYQNTDPILRLFGTTHKGWEGGPTRLLVRDAPLDPDWVRQMVENGLDLTEEKMEVSIDRIKGKAKDGGLRRTERVPAGAAFLVKMRIRQFHMDNEKDQDENNLQEALLDAMVLLEWDALGGSGSRGYGRVQFSELQLNGRSIEEQFEERKAALSSQLAPSSSQPGQAAA
ncbi:MAG: type III-A CRISPR-associated RAMP protein Csm3 [Magnetococcales bacterium]|nr:type III-A CRISPR-associated RAMP protein Csm3 [Magnetococcales bacterium]